MSPLFTTQRIRQNYPSLIIIFAHQIQTASLWEGFKVLEWKDLIARLGFTENSNSF